MMDIEQLKLIIDLVSDTTDSAVWLAVLYFFLPLIEIILYFIGWIILIPILFNGGLKFVRAVTGGDERMKSLRAILGIGMNGPITDSETEAIINKVAELNGRGKASE